MIDISRLGVLRTVLPSTPMRKALSVVAVISFVIILNGCTLANYDLEVVNDYNRPIDVIYKYSDANSVETRVRLGSVPSHAKVIFKRALFRRESTYRLEFLDGGGHTLQDVVRPGEVVRQQMVNACWSITIGP